MNGLAIPSLNGISLFSGIAGLDLGIENIIPNSRTICYVEGETYAAQVLHQKMQIGLLHPAPIYSDVVSFPSVADHFAEKVDFITAGFPCQPFSQAGSRKGTDDSRWLWSSILEIIGEVRPSFLFLENVSNLLNEWGAFDEISKSLSQIGFNIEWANVRASDVGANHQRNRLFIFAYIPSELYRITDKLSYPNEDPTNSNRDGFKNEKPLPSECSQRVSQEKWIQGDQFIKHSPLITHPNSKRRPQPNLPEVSIKEEFPCWKNHERNSNHFSRKWWSTQPPFSPVCGMDDGISYGLDRLRALGNAVVPLQASWAFYELIKRASNHLSRS